ncbi:hypothetical protein D1007_11430 [Hordeum vulgare]|nr:hypothetical protein D1007_11430 [Hordeum vulgare]
MRTAPFMTPCPNQISAFEKAVRCFTEKPVENVITLLLSTTFDSLDEVYNFYNLYSWEKDLAWQDYTCNAPDADVCSGPSTVTPEIYSKLVTAANASYVLHHYAPPMLNFQDCKFVRDTFSSIALQYCTPLERDLSLVSAGLALLASSLVLVLLLMLFADCPRRREEVSEQPSRFRVTPIDCSP